MPKSKTEIVLGGDATMTIAFRAAVGMSPGMVWHVTVQADDAATARHAACAAYSQAFGVDPEAEARIDVSPKYAKDGNSPMRCVHCWRLFDSRTERVDHQWQCKGV